ncbi:MAG: histidine phosphatase family protein [Gammaproteobacteria bacterium]|nr:histidine phosphatase family protein [Gammaproteobacteria bacterium]
MTHLILVRHGETEWNRLQRVQGHTDIALNDTGIAQARKVGQRLATETIDAIISSDLQRAYQTAQAIAEYTTHTIMLDPALRERCFGIFEGLTAEEMRQRYLPEFERWQVRDPDYEIPGGESLRRLYDRVCTVLTAIATRYAGRRVVLVCHGGVLDCAYRLAAPLALEAPRQHLLLNASLNRLRFDTAARTFTIEQWGEVEHLQMPVQDEVDRRAV